MLIDALFSRMYLNMLSIVKDKSRARWKEMEQIWELLTRTTDDPVWLNRYLLQAGFRVAAISPRQKTLKEFFLSITGDHANA